MFVLLEWCMRLPMDMLLDTSGGHKSLIYKTFRVSLCFFVCLCPVDCLADCHRLKTNFLTVLL